MGSFLGGGQTSMGGAPSQAQGGTGFSGNGGMAGMGGGNPMLGLLSMLMQSGQNGMNQQQGTQGQGLLSMLLNGGQRNLNVPSQGGAAAPSPGTAQVQTPIFNPQQNAYPLPYILGQGTAQGQGAQGNIGGTVSGMNPGNYIPQANGQFTSGGMLGGPISAAPSTQGFTRG